MSSSELDAIVERLHAHFLVLNELEQTEEEYFSLHIGATYWNYWQELQVVTSSGLGDGALIGWVDGACHRYNPLTNWSLPTHGPHRRHSHHEQSTTISQLYIIALS